MHILQNLDFSVPPFLAKRDPHIHGHSHTEVWPLLFKMQLSDHMTTAHFLHLKVKHFPKSQIS